MGALITMVGVAPLFCLCGAMSVTKYARQIASALPVSEPAQCEAACCIISKPLQKA